MPIFPQTLFTLVRGNLMPFTFFTAGQELFTSFGEIVYKYSLVLRSFKFLMVLALSFELMKISS